MIHSIISAIVHDLYSFYNKYILNNFIIYNALAMYILFSIPVQKNIYYSIINLQKKS